MAETTKAAGDLAKPEVAAATATVTELTTLTANYSIKTAADYEAGSALLMRVKGAQTKLEDARTAITKPMNVALKAINDFFRGPADKLAAAESNVKRAMIGYTDEQARLQRIEQQRVNDVSRKAREKLEERASKAAASGKVEKAEQLQQAAVTVVAPVINFAPLKIAGISPRENWHAECTDLMTLVKAIAAGQAPLSLVMANDKVLGSQARSLKSEFVAPGIRVWSDKNIAAGAA